MYKRRILEKQIIKISSFFPVVLITGPRQVGKTTILQNCSEAERKYVSLDTLEVRKLAKEDPSLFLQRFSPPVLIDEVQYAPELFPYIKNIVDKEKNTGAFWLTGSQQFHLMQNITESLAGRVGILKLQGYSQAEKLTRTNDATFLEKLKNINTQSPETQEYTASDVFRTIWKGSYPKLYDSNDDFWEIFFNSYIETYIQRDVKALLTVSNELHFLKFIKAVAARTGQLLNYADLANDVGVSQPTIKVWLSILQSSGLVYLLQPFATNITSRLIKTPKLYFLDTGLVASLTAWKTSETLELGAMNGAIFETYVVSEILKSYWNNGKNPNLYFYRDKDKKEIDLLIEEDGSLYPIEIKKKSNPDKNDIKNFKVLEKLGQPIGMGSVICLAHTNLPITEKTWSFPVAWI